MWKKDIYVKRLERVDEKNGVICLVIMFTSGDMVIEMSKMTQLLYFVLITARITSQFREII